MRTKSFSFLAVWAIAFGCATGWGSFIMPGTTFLPKAGPVGTTLGILLGGAIMAVAGWNYARMMARHPGPGGALAYVREAFGIDHGFLCAWFLSLTYVAIIWANATALTLVSRAVFGDLFSFGPHYSLAGYEIFLGDLLLSAAAVALAATLCLRTRAAARAQGALGIVFAAGVSVVFAAALAHRAGGGAPPLPPPFAPGGGPPVSQVLRVVALAPWLFVGFEAVSHVSGELRFPLRRSFAAMAAGLAASVLVYVMLALLPALAPASGPVPPLGEETLEVPTFRSAAAALGAAGVAALGAAAVGALFTNLVGNTLVASRLVAAMAREGILPAPLAAEAPDGSPRRAVLAIAAVSALVPLFGRTAIGFIVDVTTVGAAIAYAYVSAAAWRAARAEGGRLRDMAAGLAGVVLSLAVVALFLLPNLLSEGAVMATESYLVLALWCVAGIFAFFTVFRRDHRYRFGRSPVAWFSLLAMVLFLSVNWMRQSTYEATEKVFDKIERHGGETFAADPAAARDWTDTLEGGKDWLEKSVLRNSFVQTATTVLAFVLLLGLYGALRRRERNAEAEKSRAKSYFFSTVSHDIRTPLNAIVGYSEMLRAGIRDEEERQKALDSIVVSGRTLLALVNDVLDLSKLESGRMEIRPEPTDCPRLLREMTDAFRAALPKSGIELRCRTDAMPPLLLDPQRVRQVLFNLVGNALKFTERGSVEVRGTWTQLPDAAAGMLRLDVEDTGCGISPEDLERISEAYVQVGSKSARNGGTGLGLAICKQLATAMGGRFEVSSALGQGSTFSLVLPRVRPAEAAPSEAAPPAVLRPVSTAPEAAPPPAATAPAPSPAAPPEAGPSEAVPQEGVRNILVADDVPVNLMVLKAQLNRIGSFRIETAPDGAVALDCLRNAGTEPFDLVLTDIWMPVLDGEGLVRAIRTDPALQSLRVVAVTADVEFPAKSAAAGFDGVLLKPVPIDKLAAALQRLDGEGAKPGSGRAESSETK